MAIVTHGRTKDCPTPSPTGSCPGHETKENAATVRGELEVIVIKLDRTDNFPCRRPKGRLSCAQQIADDHDEDGRSVLYYAADCEAAQSFCPACKAAFYVSVAINALRDVERMG